MADSVERARDEMLPRTQPSPAAGGTLLLGKEAANGAAKPKPKRWEAPLLGDRPSARCARVVPSPASSPTLSTAAAPGSGASTDLAARPRRSAAATSAREESAPCAGAAPPAAARPRAREAGARRRPPASAAATGPEAEGPAGEDPDGRNLVGPIVERKKARRRRNVGSRPPPTRATMPAPLPSLSASSGFPSLDVPLGTYTALAAARTPSAPKRASRQVPKRLDGNCPANPPLDSKLPSSATTTAAAMDALLEASSRDADAMLAGLSDEEIRQRQREIERALPPNLLAFLKGRSSHGSDEHRSGHRNGGDRKHRGNGNRSDGGASPSSTAEAGNETSASEEPATKPAAGARADDEFGERQDRAEKERVARVLTSIRTVQDLDAAYEAEIIGDDQGPASGGGDGGDFSLACELLRSSSRRQTVWAAKTVADRLRADLDAGACCSLPEDGGGSDEGHLAPWPYPALLPVSLRCLLDVPLGGSSGYVLHTHVLQSIYCLLQLRACPSHVVDVSSQDTISSIYQLCYLDDSIPSPRMASCYAPASATSLSDDVSRGSDAAGGAVYETTSQSAQSDGASFAGDPMWTLLSKMRLIPRLSMLVRPPSSTSDAFSRVLSDEAAIATGGVLAMLAQRSPGAAVAIVQHRTLLSDLLVRLTLVPPPVDSKVISIAPHVLDPKLAIPGVRLLCCLARQSRTAAQLLDVEAFLFRVMSLGDAPTHSEAEKQYYPLQVWTLVLWRTLLRYGLALELVPTMLTLAVAHVTMGPSSSSLAPEIFSSMAVAARCVRVASQIQSLAVSDGTIPEEVVAHLPETISCIASTWRHALRHLTSQNELSFLSVDDPTTDLFGLRFYGSCLRFAECYVAMQLLDESEAAVAVKMLGLPALDDESFSSSLLSIIKSDSFRHAARFILIRITAESDCLSHSADEIQLEAGVSLFVESLTALINHILNYESAMNAQGSPFSQLHALVCDVMLEELASAIQEADRVTRVMVTDSKCRRAWRTRLLASLCNLFSSSEDVRHRGTARWLSLYTIGRLECGDESRAAILFSHDWIFHTGASSFSVSPVASMLMRELCRTQVSRLQVDHSFKLFGGFGITGSGSGSFELRSLRSEVDNVQSRATAGELQLPLGPLWLWRILSGVIVVEDGDSELPCNEVRNGEVTAIISSTLELIRDLEQSHDAFASWYTSSLEIGAKLYHTINVCLQPEPVFRAEQIQSALACLLDVYTTSRIDWAKSFIASCESHSLTKMRNGDDRHRQVANAPGSNEAKVEQLLLPREDSSARALEDFVSDMCDAFVEFGAEYPTFARCVRLFLLPEFPSPVRCMVLQKLRGVVHLLTLEGEDVPRLLPQYLPGGLPDIDQSSKDEPEFTEALCAAFHKSLGSRLESVDIVQSLAVAILARSFAICLSSTDEDAPGTLGTCTRRLTIIHRELGVRVIQATSHFLSSGGRVSDLADSTLAPQSTLPRWTVESAFENAPEWDQLISALRMTFDRKKPLPDCTRKTVKETPFTVNGGSSL